MVQLSSDEDVVAEEWQHIFMQFDSGGDLLGIRVNNQALKTSALTTVVQQSTIGLEIGSYLGGNFWDGSIDSVMCGCEAAGMTSSFADIAAALYNGGKGLKYADLTAANKTAYGLVEAWDMEDDTTGEHASVALTENGSITIGGAEGVNYISGLVGCWAQTRVATATT